MPTYAILGASGYTGSSILTLLLKDPKNHINAYVRSKSKLLSLFPSLEENKSVRIFDGRLHDIPLMASCISPDVDTVFCVLGLNENIPGTRIAQDGAQAIVAALCYPNPKERAKNPPQIIFLSSASVNPRIAANEPPSILGFIKRALSHSYEDLALAEAYLRLHQSWLNVTFVTPGGLVEDEQKGHILSLDHSQTFLSYPDLAAAMIEVAESSGYDWMGVGVLPKGKNVKIEWKAPGQIARGLVWHYLPWIGWAAKHLGLF